MYPCPKCASTDLKQESGEYALIALTAGRLQLDLKSGTSAVVVRVTVCRNCSNVTLEESR
jgi:RNA polymerase subunit RPABC4/transcription elongation factor Spt4